MKASLFLLLIMVAMTNCSQKDKKTELTRPNISPTPDTINVDVYDVKRDEEDMLTNWRIYQIEREEVALPFDWRASVENGIYRFCPAEDSFCNSHVYFKIIKNNNKEKSDFAKEMAFDLANELGETKSTSISEVVFEDKMLLYEVSGAKLLTKEGVLNGHGLIVVTNGLILKYEIVVSEAYSRDYDGDLFKDIMGALSIDGRLLFANENPVKKIIKLNKNIAKQQAQRGQRELCSTQPLRH
jgi:hypothetical protein